ncbi:hypothetical protein [Neobacillus rhizophilus]|uniref:Uncharacterized protein n=1 Tax=Neobacillus rhizophilus TaxID=2833579 RepID=A0A942U3D7_9BACI|nr:hypothetical protein [Neobacillus rhizophilus]MBS4211691.1 hypothetical protein [Neobacillus rhizophilus]MBU8919431.1 hypothetical protein [Bacillus sp. FJAT-29953]
MNFIEDIKDVKFSFLEKPPASSMSYAFVYVNNDNEHFAVKNGERLTRSELRIGKYKRVYTVNMQQQTFTYNEEVPSATRGRSFSVNLSIDIAVEHPELLVQQNAGEIGQIFNNHLPFWVESEARFYPIEEELSFARHIEEFFQTSRLVKVLREAGIVVRNVRVLTRQGIRDQYHDEAIADLDRNAEISAYQEALDLEEARRISASIKEALQAGDFITAGKLGEKNEMAKRLVDSEFNQNRAFKYEVNKQLLNLINDHSIDQFEAEQRLAKLKKLFPYLPVNLENSNRKKQIDSPRKELQSYLNKGD